jgi:hypothetical protein
MARYVPITEDLCLVEQEIKTKKTVTQKCSVNHIWIYDRSGSMYGSLPELTSQLIILSKKIPKNDILSLGWFSGEGDFDWVFKGFKISESSDYKAIEETIKKNSSSRNTTCFSEILTDTDTVIKNLSSISKTFSLHFFTDGCPVVRNYNKEIETIFSAIAKIKGQIKTSMFVSYGAYYNKELMSQMAEKLGSILVSSSIISQYSESISRLLKLTENSDPKEELDPIVQKPLTIFNLTDQGVIVYSIDDNGKVYISPQQGKSTVLYYLSNEKPNKKNWDKVEIADIDFAGKDEVLSKALYAAALILTQQTKTDVSLEIIGKIGDKNVVNSLVNAFTIEEYGKSEDLLNVCITDIDKRFSVGRDKNYLPPTDAFCVFDLLTLLMNDDRAAFYPYDPRFKYEKIGVASKTKDDYAKFIADKGCQCPFRDLTWHESRLNLSVLTKVTGTIELKFVDGKSARDVGLSGDYPTFVFRNFTFVKDGRVHTKKFYISSSDDTYRKFKNEGLVFDDTFAKNGVYGVDISNIPAVNRKIACGKTSAKELCKLALKDQQLKGTLKSLKWLKKEEVGEEEVVSASLTEDQIKFLMANGVAVDKGGSYNPPVAKEEAKDVYIAKTFDIKITGLASLPTVKKVMEKIASKKARTPVEQLVEEGINIHTVVKDTLKTKEAKSKWFSATIDKMKIEQRAIRSRLQETKFAIILGKKWFDEFKSRAEDTIKVDGQEFKFELGEEQVEI